MQTASQQGADLIVRLNPFSVVLTTLTGQRLALRAALQGQQAETVRTLPVVLGSADGQHEVRGWVHAYRLSSEQANRGAPEMSAAPQERSAACGDPVARRLGA